jgi:hypothetical protein
MNESFVEQKGASISAMTYAQAIFERCCVLNIAKSFTAAMDAQSF